MRQHRQYHHGNLEQVLIKEATLMIAESGVEYLSMRALAERVGVSRTAAYHHYKNKNELLCAIAEEGFWQWQQQFSRLFEKKPVPLSVWLDEFVQGYITFARSHPEQYDLMFGRPVWKSGEPSESLKLMAGKVFQQYVEFIRHWQNKGVFSTDIEGLRLAQVSWSMLHGICRLLNDGVYLGGEAIDSMCDAAKRILLTHGA